MKDLKDYLHLYIGCDYKHVDDQFNEITLTLDWRGTKFWSDNCKLILRPLSDMTEEEKITVKISKGTPSEAGWGISNTECWSFEQVRQLLLWHFDLFELIEAGLAIDKTTLK